MTSIGRDAAPPEIEALVDQDRVRLLYAFALASVGATVLGSMGLCVAVGDFWTRTLLQVWLGVMSLLVLVRGADFFVFQSRRRRGMAFGKNDIRRYFCLAVACACTWGCFPPIFFPMLDMVGRSCSLFVLALIAGGSVSALAPSLVTAVAFSSVILLPTSLTLWHRGDPADHLLAGFGVTMLASLSLSAYTINRTLTRGLRFGRVNQHLVAAAERQRVETEGVNVQLSAAQVALHVANHSLEQRIEARTAELEREISERKTYAEALARLASTDPLTGLCNRHHFAERLARMLATAERTGRACAVLFLDLDNFKQINDVRGHGTGDQVLQAVSDLLSTRAGAEAEIARWGGDEFVLAMLLDPGSDAALELSQDLRRVLAAPMQTGLDVVRVDVTIGIAVFPEHGRTQDELIRAADVAMYQAKKEGRGRITMFDRGLARGLSERHMLEQALRDAVERSELSLVFQPIVSARTGRCDAMEALVRWYHPSRGLIAPDHFIPVAEQSGQIVAIGRWVLHQACRAAAGWPAGLGGDDGIGQAPPVTVNVSVAQVVSGTLLADVEAALAGAGLPPSRLQLEITESMFVSDHVRVTPVFEELRRRGLRILLDDFGTGFSSLAYLGKLPIDVIKIDQSFVRNAERNGFAIINAILSIARALSLEVTAEGVETPLQRSVLSSIGVERLQGYLIAKPMAGEKVVPWLAAHERALGGCRVAAA
jgi:diguanylate cyclase (GGDEF)-like protein